MFKMLLMLSWDIFISQLTVKELCCFMMLVRFVYHNGGKICLIDNLRILLILFARSYIFKVQCPNFKKFKQDFTSNHIYLQYLIILCTYDVSKITL